MTTEKDIDKALFRANQGVHSDIVIVDSQYDEDKYYCTIRESIVYMTGANFPMRDFHDVFPEVENDGLEKISWSFRIDIQYGLSYTETENNNFIFNDDVLVHDYKLSDFVSKHPEVSNEQIKYLADNSEETRDFMLSSVMGTIEHYKSFVL